MEFKLEGAEYIELKSLLKVCGLVQTGGEAKSVIDDGKVQVNGLTETRKANKIKPGMTVVFAGETINVVG